MRRALVFTTLIAMLTSLGVLLAGHPRPFASLTVGFEGDHSAGVPPDRSRSAPLASAAEPENHAPVPSEAGLASEPDSPTTMRKLRVVTLGWEVLAPAVLANDGLGAGPQSRFRSSGLDVELIAVDSLDELEARLARGGEVESGADIAILPLPSFVAGYERTKALEPRMFFVAGFSAGRDLVVASDRDLLIDAIAGKGPLRVVGERTSAATALTGFALVAHGVAPERIELVTSLPTEGPSVRAIERSLARRGDSAFDPRELILSSAAAPRLIPFVAVAPASFVDRHERELARFSEVWLSGVDMLAADVPAGARRIAAIAGAPEAVDLVEYLAHVRFSTLGDNVRLAALAGRGAVSLDRLFERTWMLWRSLGVLTNAAPERAPLDSDVIARVALGGTIAIADAESGTASGKESRHPALVVVVTGEREAIADELGFWAGVFDRPELELRVAEHRRIAQQVIGQAVDRFDLPPRQIRAGRPLRKGERSRIVVAIP